MNLNAKASPARGGNSPAQIKSQGVYESIAKWRRQQTLTDKQLDPAQNSCCRRSLYKTGQATHTHR